MQEIVEIGTINSNLITIILCIAGSAILISVIAGVIFCRYKHRISNFKESDLYENESEKSFHRSTRWHPRYEETSFFKPGPDK